MVKKVWIEIVFWLHLPIVLLWFGLFLVPKSLWGGVVVFHFWYIVSIMFVQFLWGLTFWPMIHRGDIICPITTLMQSMRGYPRISEKNYGHSFIAEFCERIGVRLNYKGVNAVLFVTLVLVFVRYFLFAW